MIEGRLAAGEFGNVRSRRYRHRSNLNSGTRRLNRLGSNVTFSAADYDPARVKNMRNNRRFSAMVLSSLMMAGCSSLEPGMPTLKSGANASLPTEDWRNQLYGGDAYVKFKVTAVAVDGLDANDICGKNYFSRYFSRDKKSSVFANINGHANYPIITITISDSDNSCSEMFKYRELAPILVLPVDGMGSSVIETNFLVVNEDKSKMDVEKLIKDALAVAPYFAGPTSGLITTASALSAGQGISIAQKQADEMLQDMKKKEFFITLSAKDVRNNQTTWTVPIIASKNSSDVFHFANVEISASLIQSVFDDYKIDSQGRSTKLPSSNPKFSTDAKSKMLGVLVVDPTINKNGEKTGTKLRIDQYILNRLSDNLPSIRAVMKENSEGARRELDRFCRNMRDIYDNGPVSLTDRDEIIVLWAMLSESPAWKNQSGLFNTNVYSNECFTESDYRLLDAMGLDRPVGSGTVEISTTP
jgi:hypothetical protein